jgi:hypothetical protein
VERNLLEIDQYFSKADTPQLYIINGMGGIGKTTLAAAYFRWHQNEYRHLAWLSVSTVSGITEALLSLATPLGLSLAAEMPVEARMRALLDAMRLLDKPSLLVLDGVDDPADLAASFGTLPSLTNFRILLTTRASEMAGVVFHKLGPLNPANALALFKTHYPRHSETENETLSAVFEIIGYSPLLIELLAKNLRQINRLKVNYNLSDLLSDLKTKGLLHIPEKTVGTLYRSESMTLRQATLRAILTAMFDFVPLDAAEKEMLAAFAKLPLEPIAFSLIESVLPKTPELENTLLSLAQKGWLDYHEPSATFNNDELN